MTRASRTASTWCCSDYRDLRGSYSKLVSIEMIEAVGWQYFDTFFSRCSSLLEPDGLMLVQAITIDDPAYEIEKGARSFANEHDLPGRLPALAGGDPAGTEHATDMRILDVEDITASYPQTLRHWRENWLAEPLMRPSGWARPPLPAPVRALLRLVRGRVHGAPHPGPCRCCSPSRPTAARA